MKIETPEEFTFRKLLQGFRYRQIERCFRFKYPQIPKSEIRALYRKAVEKKCGKIKRG